MKALHPLTYLSFIVLLSACQLTSNHSDQLPKIQTENPWFVDGQQAISQKLSVLDLKQQGQAKNVIVFLGDGMGISTLTAARILQGQLNGKSGEENELSFERFPFTGLAKTYNTDQQTPDSAGTMSAIMTGVKTDAGIIAIDETVEKGNCKSAQGHEMLSALEQFELHGKSTGIVSTARITHATPAATYAKSPSRNWENDSKIPTSEKACKDIALQLIEFEKTLDEKFPQTKTNGIEVVLGGGRREFLPKDAQFNEEDPSSEKPEGKRSDNRHLINEWQQLYPQGQYVNNRDNLLNEGLLESSHIFGLFHPSHMRYEKNRNEDNLGEPSLSEMTAVAIDKLQQNKDGYFLMVESGRIDHSHHAGNAYNALHDTIELSNAVEVALSKVDLSETLIIVTADHSHVMTIAGYPKRGNPILGKVVAPNQDEPTLMEDGLPYTTLGYLNGRGMHDLHEETDADASYDHPINVGRKDISNIDTEQPGYHQEALIPRSSETHGGEDVGIYAIGPGAHLVSGVNEQNVIYHVMKYSAGL